MDAISKGIEQEKKEDNRGKGNILTCKYEGWVRIGRVNKGSGY